MTRTEARKEREKQRRRRIVTWTLLILVELLVAVVPAAITAAVAIPVGRALRGYRAFGIEHMIVAAVFCIAYGLIHKAVCDRILGEG